MWEATVDGRTLTFHLAGINNQNFIMLDEETGSWWQQVTGEAILGPLSGRRLKQVVHDELTLSTWKQEQPGGRVLRPNQQVAHRYAPANWEEGIAALPTVTPTGADDELPPRELVMGIDAGGASKAYTLSAIERQSPIIDVVGSVPVLVVMGDDRRSVRAFERTASGKVMEFFVKPNTSPLRLVDSTSGSEWDFAGRVVSGPLAGMRLNRIVILRDYWFDWKAYHPDTSLYR